MSEIGPKRISMWPSSEEGKGSQPWSSLSTTDRSLDCVLMTRVNFCRLLRKRMTLSP